MLPLMIVAAGVAAYSHYQSGQLASRAARKQAKIKQAMAKEMLDKMVVQEQRMTEQGQEFKSSQMTEYAANGAQLGTGATLLAMEDTNMKTAMAIGDMKRETMFRINQMKMGVSVDLQQGRDAANAGSVMAASSVLEGAAAYQKGK